MFSKIMGLSTPPELSGIIDITGSPYGAEGIGGAGDDAIIQAAITALSDVDSPSTLYFPNGTYLISTTMTLEGIDVVASPGAIFIPGADDTVMVDMQRTSTWTGGFFNTFSRTSFAGTCFKIDGANINGGFVAFNQRSPRINNVDLLAYAASPDGCGTAFLITSSGSGNQATFGRIENIRLRNFTTGLKLYAHNSGYVNSWFFQNILFMTCKYGIHLQSTATNVSTQVNANKFVNIGFQPSVASEGVGVTTVNDILIDQGGENNFSNVDFMDSSTPSDGAVKILPGSYQNIVIGSGTNGSADYVKDYGSLNYVSSKDAYIPSTDSNCYGTLWQPGTAGTLADGEQSITTFSAPYAALGDALLAAPMTDDLQDCLYCAYPSDVNTAAIMVVNRSGSAATFTSSYWRVKRFRGKTATHQATVNPDNCVAGSFITVGVTLNGATLGDLVVAGPGISLGGLFMTCTITAANLATVVLHNFTGADINLDSSSWNFWHFPASSANHCASVSPASLADAAQETFAVTLIGNKGGLGDFVQAAYSVDTQDYCISGYLKGLNQFEVVSANETGSTLDLGTTINVRLWVWTYFDGWRK